MAGIVVTRGTGCAGGTGGGVAGGGVAGGGGGGGGAGEGAGITRSAMLERVKAPLSRPSNNGQSLATDVVITSLRSTVSMVGPEVSDPPPLMLKVLAAKATVRVRVEV